MMIRRLVVSALAVVAIATAGTGCARRVPGEDLDAEGARVGAIVVMKSGETLTCRLLSLTRDTAVVESYYPVGGDVDVRGTGEGSYLSVKGVRIEGEVVAVEREGIHRTAVVRRSLRLADVHTATFHRSGSEASLGPILSALVGPIVGALLALLI
jgi:hypothetical protein